MTDSDLHLAVVGATGTVGRAMVEILHQRKFPLSRLSLLASSTSVGESVAYGRREQAVMDAESFDFSDCQIVLMAAGSEVARIIAPKAAAAGALVIDNSSEFRYDEDVPLVVPEVNPQHIAERMTRNIIANPNCSTIQMMLAVAPIHRALGVQAIQVATYQSVSGAGRAGIDELARQTMDMLGFKTVEPEFFPVQMAFNVIPQIDRFEDNGYTREEMKIVWESRKILDSDTLAVNATAVRVPVFYGHSEAVHLSTREPVDVAAVRQLLSESPGITVVDHSAAAAYPTAVTHAAGSDSVFVGRIRADLDNPHGVNLWVVSDNVRKGAALNAIQIAEFLVKSHL